MEKLQNCKNKEERPNMEFKKKRKAIDEVPEAEEQRMSRTEKGRLLIVQETLQINNPGTEGTFNRPALK